MEVIHTCLIFAGVDIHYKLASVFPEWMFSEAVAVTICTTLSSMFLLPYLINLIDRVMHVQAKTGVQRELRKRARENSIGGGGRERSGTHPLTHSPPKPIRYVDGSMSTIDYDQINSSKNKKG